MRCMYVDRFIDIVPKGRELICQKCNRVLGTPIIYEKELRPAYRLYVDSVTKKIVPSVHPASM